MTKGYMSNVWIIVVILIIMGGMILTGQFTGKPQISNKPSVSTIAPAALIEETKRLINSLGIDNVHVFDIRHSVGNILFTTIDYYEKGIKKDPLLGIGTNIFDRDQSQVVFVYDFDQNMQQERELRVSTALLDDSGSSSSQVIIPLPDQLGMRISKVLSTENKLHINQPVTVITVIEHSGNSIGFSTGTISEFDETGVFPTELAEYERVYLFRVMLRDSMK